MGSYLSAEEIKQNYIQKLGSDFGYLYYELWYEVSILHLRWDEYVELFGTNPSWIDLLNDSAPRFFRTVQDALWESTLLHITRLTDPIKSCGKENLSIQCLLEFIDADIKPIISEQIKDAVTKSKFCRDWRNRHIAHKDLKLVIDRDAKPLEKASRAKVNDTLKSIVKVINTISEHYMDATVEFNAIKSPYGAENLVSVLDDGLKVSRDRKKRIESGKYLPEDLEYRDH